MIIDTPTHKRLRSRHGILSYSSIGGVADAATKISASKRIYGVPVTQF